MCAGYFAPRIFMIEVGVFGTDRHVLSQSCCFLQIMDALMILSVFFSSALVLFGSAIYYRRLLSSYNPNVQKMSEPESSKLSKKCARNAGKNRQNRGKKNVVKHKGKTAPKCDGPISQKPSSVSTPAHSTKANKPTPPIQSKPKEVKANKIKQPKSTESAKPQTCEIREHKTNKSKQVAVSNTNCCLNTLEPEEEVCTKLRDGKPFETKFNELAPSKDKISFADRVPSKQENCEQTTVLTYVSDSEIIRIMGKGGEIIKHLEAKHGVKIYSSYHKNKEKVIKISGANALVRKEVEYNIRDMMSMTVSLPNVDPATYTQIKNQVDLGKLRILHINMTEDETGSITFTGLARYCKGILHYRTPVCN